MGNRDDMRIRETKDYSIFEQHEINRRLHRVARPAAYRALRVSMEARGFLKSKAIHVCRQPNTNKLKIVGGHNRFDVAKELGLPICYIIDDAIDNPHEDEIGGSTAWTARDWIDGYANAQVADYLSLIEFREKHGLTLGTAIALMAGLSANSGSGYTMERVKSGAFRIGDMTHAKEVVRITDAARAAKIEFATRHSFVSAVSACLRVPAFDSMWMIHKIQKYPAHMIVRTTVSEWLVALEDLYNYGTKPDRKLNLAFLAKEAMRQRKENFAGKRGTGGGRKVGAK